MEKQAPVFETVRIPIGDSISDGENYSEFSTASSKTDKMEGGSPAVVLPKITTTTTKNTRPAKNSGKSVHFTATDNTQPIVPKKAQTYLKLPPLSPAKESYPQRRTESRGSRENSAVKGSLERSPLSKSEASFEEKNFKVSVLLQEHIQTLKKAMHVLIKEARNAILETKIKERDEKAFAENQKRSTATRRILKTQTSFDSTRSGEEIFGIVNNYQMTKENQELGGKDRQTGSKVKKTEVSLMERYRVPRDTRSLMDELKKLGKTAEATSLKELVQSQEMAEKELRKALKKEKILEKEEQKKREKEEHDRKRRETHYQKMEELAKEEAEKRETVMRLKEMKTLLSLKRQKRNLLLWNEIQMSILSTRTTRAYKFSYYPLMPYKAIITTPETPTQSPEPSVSMTSDCSSPTDSISSLDYANLKDFD